MIAIRPRVPERGVPNEAAEDLHFGSNVGTIGSCVGGKELQRKPLSDYLNRKPALLVFNKGLMDHMVNDEAVWAVVGVIELGTHKRRFLLH